ncbi:MAG TPA: hypothetical protein VL025_08285 [Thermoanaerobaculia bacterium]|nr:hypothetical protein [Thermoanaerobaculia bacterium]
MSDASPRTLDAWLRAAYASEEAGCPPPESFLEAEVEGLSSEERRALDAHADRCPACAAERDLARMFDAAPDEADVRPEDLSYVVSRLERPEDTLPVRPASNVTPFPGPRRAEAAPASAAPRASRPSRSLLRFAAAAVLVLGGLLGYRAFQTPEPMLPAPPEAGGVVRGSEVEVLGPVGDVTEIPTELRWVPKGGAAFYRVRMIAVDDAVLWEGTALAPPARLPEEVAGRLHRAVLYTWTVEALDASGAPLAISEPVRFKVRIAP